MLRILLVLNVGLILGIGLFSWWAYPRLPDPIPVHFDWHGQPDRWAAKTPWRVAVLPLFQVGMLLAFLLIYWKPQIANYPPKIKRRIRQDPLFREQVYALMRQLMLWFALWTNLLLAAIHIGALMSALEQGRTRAALLHPATVGIWLGVLLGSIAFVLIKLYRLAAVDNSRE